MNKTKLYIVTALLIAMAHPLLAAEPYVYPAKGQSSEQQDRDKYECYSWARSNTGYDPANPPVAPSSVPAEQQTGGAARGALGGAAIGAIAGDSSEAAGRGAAAGAVLGGIRQRRANETAVHQQQQQQAAQASGRQSDYDRAYAACLEGRDYTVK